MFTAEIRKKRVQQLRAHSNWQWHLDEVFVKIDGETHYLWWAVDHEGEVLESFVTKRRDRKAALKFLRKTMKRYGHPHVIVPDLLRSYGAAMKVIGNIEKAEIRTLAQQSGGNFTLAISTKRERNTSLQAHSNLAEIHRRAFHCSQPFQPRTQPLQSIKFQAEPNRRSRLVPRSLRGLTDRIYWKTENGSHSSDSID